MADFGLSGIAKNKARWGGFGYDMALGQKENPWAPQVLVYFSFLGTLFLSIATWRRFLEKNMSRILESNRYWEEESGLKMPRRIVLKRSLS